MKTNNIEDKFFDLYKQNIAFYYNNKKILKIINEGTTNIPSTVSEMLVNYETNIDKIKNFNTVTYNNHYEIVKTILNKLFKKNEPKKLFFDDIQSNFNLTKSSFINFIKNSTKSAVSTGRTLSNTSSRVVLPRISSAASSLELPTDKQVVNKVKQIGKKVIDSASTQETNENKIIKDDYKKFLEFIVKEIFINDSNLSDSNPFDFDSNDTESNDYNIYLV